MQADAAADVDVRQKPTSNAPKAEPTEAAETRAPTGVTGDIAFRQLDVRSIGLWRLTNGMIVSAISTVVLVAGVALFWVVPFPLLLLIPLVWLGLLGLGILSVVWWPQWEYGRWSYGVNDRLVELRYGVVWHVSVQIPLARLQHVDLHRGPLESRWGLATLEIHTAGTRNASHRICGLDAAVASKLRDQLVNAANREPNGSTKT